MHLKHFAARVVAALVCQTLCLAQSPEQNPLAKYDLAPAPLPSGLLLRKGDRLAICGDSITEQRMYSRLIEDYLTACAPELRVSVRQFGWGGERADGFLKRMTNDCLRFNPTIVTTCYGMNDHEYRPYVDSIGDAYRSNTIAIVESFKAHGARVALGSPSCVGERSWWQAGATTEALNMNLARLRNIDIEIARDEHVAFADVFQPMLAASFAAREKYGKAFTISGGDSVHPGWAGHVMMAYAFLKSLGLDGAIADFKLDLGREAMTVSEGHKIVGRHDGEFTICSSRYAFCPGAPPGLAADWFPTIGYDNITNSDSLRAGMQFIPFNDDLNRFMLTVTNAPAENYLVAWGDHDATFTRAQLARGINLAAAFPLNPFSAKFALVDEAVAAKQDFETREIKVWFRSSAKAAATPQLEARTDAVVTETERMHKALEKAVQAAYSPVTYTLKVTPL